MSANSREPIPDEAPSQGGGLFMRCIFCAFIMLALFSFFALHTDFSDKTKEVFKAAVRENSERFIPQIIETARGKLFSEKEDVSAEGAQTYIPDGEVEFPQETYPNPILMPSETTTENGYTPFSDR